MCVCVCVCIRVFAFVDVWKALRGEAAFISYKAKSMNLTIFSSAMAQ